MTDKPRFDAPNWIKIYRMLLKQSQQICQSGFKPDVIVGVSRGGWLPARVLSDLLENANLANVKVECYLGIDKSGETPRLTQCVSASVASKRVLVVDEVADSGRSLQLTFNHIREEGAKEIKTAVLYYKPRSIFRPDWWAAETSCWVVFPWEMKETIRGIVEAHKTDAAKTEQELAELANAGVSRKLMTRFLKEFSEAKIC
ncbi:MAG: phosphoribosyltransferase [Candidatus Bathyarchaeota archaeon]|nr:phosphoribosyltransferase [Candidatus Bathyarchaeota archaeon]